ncbi:MAG TPA: hypothetical protein VNQ76_09725 [Planctomicrobium sp.]|nr:hypothetical protein [Planctomicrobium sp.]
MLTVCALLTFLTGCGTKVESPQVTPVSGQVRYRGELLTSGSITFIPPNESSNRPAIATIDKNGQFKLSSFKAGDGVAPGEYRVVISSLLSGPDIDNPGVPEVSAIPKKYSSIETTNLTATIPDGEKKMEFTFDLVD